MEIVVESTEKFEKDIANYTKKEKTNIVEKINHHISLLSNNHQAFYQNIHQIPLNLSNLPEDECSLYVMKINSGLRVIFTVDEDPIFEKKIVTLFRVVKKVNLEQTYSSIAESLYQDFLQEKKEILETV